MSFTRCDAVLAPAAFSGGDDGAVSKERLERTRDGLLVDLEADAAVDICPSRVREPLQVLEDERPEPVRLDALPDGRTAARASGCS